MADEDWAKKADDQEKMSWNLGKGPWIKGDGSGDYHPAKLNGFKEEDDDEKPMSSASQSLLRKLLRESLVKSNQELEIQQKDPNSPLYSVKTFEELNLVPQLIQGIYNMGFNHPSRIQETALPMLLATPPENMIAQSQSGTGKTTAFVMTMLSRVDLSKKFPQCLCLSPTYELALQIGKAVEEMGGYMDGLSVAYAVRNQRVSRSEDIKSQIIIGTAGTMLKWCCKQKVVDMEKIEVFVLDEADVMIDTQGFKDMSIKLYKQLRKDCQVLLFSATYDDEVMAFAKRVVVRPNVIRLRKDEETLDNIKQYYVKCRTPEQKYLALTGLSSVLCVGQCIIFCHTKAMARWLANKMLDDKYVVALLSGNLDVEERAAIIKRFKSGKEKWLITTNLCSRGIDVEQVTLVINFDLPVRYDNGPNFETYLHRIGRTGRFGKSGVAINFVTSEQDWNNIKEIERHFNKKMIGLIDTEDYDEMHEKLCDD